MSLLRSLADGVDGLRFDLPQAWDRVDEGSDHVRASDPRFDATCWVFAFPGVHLDLAPERFAALRRAAEYPARDMFERVYEADAGATGEPRTADPQWSPVIQFERLEIDDSPVVQSIHRMSYRPGQEIVLAHLLIPRPSGLFEWRIATRDDITGYRESVAFLDQSDPEGDRDGDGDGDGDGDFGQFPSQSEMDDPGVDERFPEHCLSRARAALDAIRADLRLESRRLPEFGLRQDLGAQGGSQVPPPRFFPSDDPGTWQRCNFCGTDGIEQFLVSCHTGASAANDELSRYALATTESIHRDAQVDAMRASLLELEGAPSGSCQTLVEGQGHAGALRNLSHWFRDDEGRIWSSTLVSSPAVPLEELAREVLESAGTWRPDPPTTRRRDPWWRRFRLVGPS